MVVVVVVIVVVVILSTHRPQLFDHSLKNIFAMYFTQVLTRIKAIRLLIDLANTYFFIAC